MTHERRDSYEIRSFDISTSYSPEDDSMENEIQIAELRSDVRHIQTEVGDIKISVRDISQGQIILRDKVDTTAMATSAPREQRAG